MERYNLSFEELSLFSMVADLFSLYILLLFAKYFQMVGSLTTVDSYTTLQRRLKYLSNEVYPFCLLLV